MIILPYRTPLSLSFSHALRPLIRKCIHIPGPHLGHVLLLLVRHWLEPVTVLSKAKDGVYSEAHAHNQEGAQHDEEDDDWLREEVFLIALCEVVSHGCHL